MNSLPSAESTLAIILGSDDIGGLAGPGRPGGFANSAAIANSAAQFYDYLQDVNGLGLPKEQIANWFNFDGPVETLLNKITAFVKQGSPRDLIVYFIGHGAFDDKEYYLCLSGTKQNLISDTSLSVRSLKKALSDHVYSIRTYLILDACYSGRASRSFEFPINKDRAVGDPCSRGVSLLCSANEDSPSHAPELRAYSPFSGVLLDVLTLPRSGGSESMSLRDAYTLLLAEMRRRTNPNAAEPRLYDPFEPVGKISGVPLFPNPARFVQWCGVLSESPTEAGASHSLKASIHHAWDLMADEVEAIVQRPLSPRPHLLLADAVVASPAALEKAIRSICQCEIAFFDVTHYEPVVMLLLGIRAVARRGVTVCSVGGASAAEAASDVPFHLAQINIRPHSLHDIKTLCRLATEGLERLMRDPDQYADLPVFDSIRRIAPDSRDRLPISCDEQVLFLCSFSKHYRDTKWDQVQNNIQKAVTRLRKTTPQILRTLDLTSPRLVSDALFEAMRRADCCIADWTEWRPNVFFELGVRFASNAVDLVSILDAQDATDAAPLVPTASDNSRSAWLDRTRIQRERLAKLFDVIRYDLGVLGKKKQGLFNEIVNRYQQNHEAVKQGIDRERHSINERLAPATIFLAVWDEVDPAHESAAKATYQLIEDLGRPLLFDASQGQSGFVYPARHQLTQMAKKEGRERLLAAWLYLHFRVGAEELNANRSLRKKYDELSVELAGRLIDSNDNSELATLILNATNGFE